MKSCSKNPITYLLISLFISASPTAEMEARVVAESKAPEIHVSESLKSRSNELLKTYIKARKRIETFASHHGWQKNTEQSFVDKVEVYDTKDGFDKRLRELCPELEGKKIPRTFVAGIEKRICFSVSPGVYEVVYPQGKGKNAFEKLLAHELGHRLHVRILNGEENRMGPIWFFEGFATYASQQFPGNKPNLSKEEIQKILEEKERGSYINYNKVLKHFLKRHDLKELVEKAGQKDFSVWLLKSDGIKN